MSDTYGRAVLSVDLEFASHTPAFRSASGELADPEIGRTAVGDLLDRFAANDATATFFVVSDIAERTPAVVERIANAGHEVASHTHTHPEISNLNSAELRYEIRVSRERLESVTGKAVNGFRAPSFDIPPGLFGALAETGYEYDSSVVPCRKIPGWYGGEYEERRPVPVAEIGDPADLMELPIGVMPGLRLPLSGTWLRFFGPRYTVAGMRWLASKGIAPVIYVHPWEFVELPRVSGVPRRIYYRTGEWMFHALDRILAAPFEFVTAREIVALHT